MALVTDYPIDTAGNLMDYPHWVVKPYGCTCPPAWWGIYPPYCPVHNPIPPPTYYTITTTYTSPPVQEKSKVDATRPEEV